MQVLLMPAKLCIPTVDRMQIGEIGYVPPSALLMTRERGCFLQPNASVQRSPDDAASMHITRIADGYVADITYCTYRWQKLELGEILGSLVVLRVVYGDEILR